MTEFGMFCSALGPFAGTKSVGVAAAAETVESFVQHEPPSVDEKAPRRDGEKTR